MLPFAPHSPRPWLVALALACAATQSAPTQAAPNPAAALPAALALAPLPRGDTLGQAAVALGEHRIVKGAPYCADTVHESVQVLADGNRIVHADRGRLCRDGEGRTRQETERAGRRQVWLSDPVAGETWLLDPQRRTARRIGGARPQPVTVVREVVRQRDAQGRETEQVELRVLRVDGEVVHSSITRRGGAADAAEAGRAASELRAAGAGPRGPGVRTPLPARDIEGQRAQGERTTWTLPAGAVGNERPIQLTREVWTSPELGLTLLSTDHDPRSGETRYRLSGLTRGEPDPALLRVPADRGHRRAGTRELREVAGIV
ncbi:hypothetical protein ABXN37_16295 [Piscinibacter sakaiensis]|uniref:hypothetical protein n=1 Tax=Piscinibacter sakaiensis TaxID=1547922 RepID=UPI0037281422